MNMTNKGNEAAAPLPSTTDDIPMRSQPLSPEELADIRSLIGAAKKVSSSVHDDDEKSTTNTSNRVKQPLDGQRVMVPITSKAFFEGVLKPTKTDDMDKGDYMNEQIIVNKEGKLVEMTRAEAADMFDKLNEGPPTPPKKTVPTKAAPQKSAIREGRISSSMQSSTETEETEFPLMEIRETCDVGGNIINSEVVNMSNTIQRLGNATANIQGEGDGKQLGNLLAQTLQEGEEDIAKDLHVSYTEDREGYVHVVTKSKPKEPISDEDYGALYARLEELERLEDEDARAKLDNVKSSKRLQSTEWSKGFLNKTKKSRGKSPSALRARGKSPSALRVRGKSPSALKKEDSEKNVAFSSVSFNAEESEIKDKLVSFSTVSFNAEDDEIKDKLVSFSTVSFNAENDEINDALSDVESEKSVSFSTAKPIDGSVSFSANEDCEIPSNLRKPYSLHSDKELRVSFSSVSFNTEDIEIDDLSRKTDDDEISAATPQMLSKGEDNVPTVSFSNNNEVKEIPRIGQAKVPPRPAPGPPVSFNSGAESFAPVDSAPFDDSVFRGVVKERNVINGNEVKDQLPKKKLSRFAQQRLERG